MEIGEKGDYQGLVFNTHPIEIMAATNALKGICRGLAAKHGWDHYAIGLQVMEDCERLKKLSDKEVDRITLLAAYRLAVSMDQSKVLATVTPRRP